MRYTSSEANKLLKKLKDELSYEKDYELCNSSYIRALEEKDEDVRPEYDIAESNKKIFELNEKIRKVKHKINEFNAKTVVPDTDGMTIDQVLIFMPQLHDMITRYSQMSRAQKKSRVTGRTRFIEYTIANYDPADAKKLAEKYSDELSRLQSALDQVNTTVKGIELNI